MEPDDFDWHSNRSAAADALAAALDRGQAVTTTRYLVVVEHAADVEPVLGVHGGRITSVQFAATPPATTEPPR